MKLNHVFRSVEEEVSDKLKSMLSLSDKLEEELLALCQKNFSNPEAEKLKKTLTFAKSLDSKSPEHPTTAIYFTHPTRIALLSLSMMQEPDIDTVIVGVMHNIIEVYDMSESDLKDLGYSDFVVQGILLLTINREFEEDPRYLKRFYGDIEQFSEKLSLVRCIDKLDNLLTWELFEESKFRTKYIELANRFVAPMAHRLAPSFGRFFEEICNYADKVGCNTKMSQQYKLFLQKHEEGKS